MVVFSCFCFFNSCTQYNSLKTLTHRAEDITVLVGKWQSSGQFIYCSNMVLLYCQISTGVGWGGAERVEGGRLQTKMAVDIKLTVFFLFLFFFLFFKSTNQESVETESRVK